MYYGRSRGYVGYVHHHRGRDVSQGGLHGDVFLPVDNEENDDDSRALRSLCVLDRLRVPLFSSYRKMGIG